MKVWRQLTKAEQAQAVNMIMANLLKDLSAGKTRLMDADHKHAQNMIDAIRQRCEADKTPWLLQEKLIEVVGPTIRSIAAEMAQDGVYPESQDKFYCGILK